MSRIVDIGLNRKNLVCGSEHVDDYFAELCALSATGTLSAGEWNHLQTHLAQCASCRAILDEYDRVVSTILPAMAGNLASADDENSPDGWDIAKAEAALFDRIDQEGIEPKKDDTATESKAHSRALWPIAVAVALLASSYIGYRIGAFRSDAPIFLFQRAQAPAPPAQIVRVSKALSQQPDALSAKHIAALQERARADSSEIASLQTEQQSLMEQLSQKDTELSQEQQQRAGVEQQLLSAQTNAESLQAKLNEPSTQVASGESSENLEKRVEALTTALEEKQQQIGKQQELLTYDRDIRDLIGARELYIGEIYDVAKSGETQKPFGRVFYTKGKSLIFYAYDLDQQPGVKLASTFQAWGRRGIDQQHDVSLGIFYQDDQNKKRWILKSNDSLTLYQLDAVFVTIEPHGASSKPTGKPLLFTYLKLPPNHP
jgi:hypothetical protein